MWRVVSRLAGEGSPAITTTIVKTEQIEAIAGRSWKDVHAVRAHIGWESRLPQPVLQCLNQQDHMLNGPDVLRRTAL